jgi:hypothetical protein
MVVDAFSILVENFLGAELAPESKVSAVAVGLSIVKGSNRLYSYE